MELPRPAVDASQAARIAGDHYGIVGSARELPAEFDRNFLIRTGDGQGYVLKVSPGDRPADDLEMQVAVLEFLAGVGPGSRVPQVVVAKNGASLSRVGFSDGSEHWVRLLTFVTGEPLVRMSHVPSTLLWGIGQFLAQLDSALTTFDHPGSRRRIPWDITRTLELADSLALIEVPSRRRLVEENLDRFERVVVPLLDHMGRSVIHNDANDHNLLVGDLDPERARLCGLIDFGDMIHTITVAEPAIAAAYLMLGSEEPWTTAAHVVGGYHSVRPLNWEERQALPDLVAARLCASVLMSARARVREPDNEYLLVSERPVWELLDRLESCDSAAFFRMMKRVES